MIPICPNCKQPLKSVWEEIHQRWEFNQEKKEYEKSVKATYVAICVNCDADVSDIFEEGICNWR